MVSDPRLVTGSRVVQLAGSSPQTGWSLALCEAAREAGGSFRYSLRCSPPVLAPGHPAADPVRAAEEAARRARSKSRRYCAANRLNRLGTLTYRGAGCHDPSQLRADVAVFFRSVRGLLGGTAFAYLWTSEWHQSGHGLHVHFAVGRFIHRAVIEQSWPHGFVHIKLLGDLPTGSGAVAEARQAARYLSKYVGKDFNAQRSKGLHRYELGQGFQPKITAILGRTRDEVIDRACSIMRDSPETVWFSDQNKDWEGPPALWLQWRG